MDYFYPQDIHFQLSKNSNKPVMYIRADGPNNCEDADKVKEVWDFYYDKCDNTILSGLIEAGEIYCYFLTVDHALQAFNDWFPQKNVLSEDEMDFYFHVSVISVDDNVYVSNE